MGRLTAISAMTPPVVPNGDPIKATATASVVATLSSNAITVWKSVARGSSGRRMSAAPTPASASVEPSKTTVAPSATMPKSRGKRSRANTTFPPRASTLRQTPRSTTTMTARLARSRTSVPLIAGSLARGSWFVIVSWVLIGAPPTRISRIESTFPSLGNDPAVRS